MGSSLSAWKEDLVRACDYIMDETIVKIPAVLQDERFIQWCIYERWRKKRKGTKKYVRMQCHLASVQQFSKTGHDTSESPRAVDFAIFRTSKERIDDLNTVPAVCIELCLAKMINETSSHFRERCLKDIFRLAYLRHHSKTEKAYFVM